MIEQNYELRQPFAALRQGGVAKLNRNRRSQLGPGVHNVGNHDLSGPGRDESGSSILSPEQHEAHLHCTLLAQKYGTGCIYLESDPQSEKDQFPIDIHEKTDLWYNRYTRMLGYCGWAYSSFKWESIEGPGFTLSEKIPDAMKSVCTEAEIDTLKHALKTAKGIIEENSEDERMRDFGVGAKCGKSANFDISVLGFDDNGILTSKRLYVSCESIADICSVLFWKYDPAHSSLAWARTSWNLDWSTYKKRQQWIRDGVEPYVGEIWSLENGK